MRALPFATALACLLAACNRAPAPEPAASAPAPAAAPSPAPEPQPPQPVGLGAVLAEGVAIEPGQKLVPLFAEAEAVVHPAATFRVVLEGKFPDARLSLLDARDALVASEGARELGAQTTLTLKPSAPLTSAATYLVRVDGASVRQVHDDAGQAYEPMTATVIVAGEQRPAGERKELRKR